MTAPVSPIATLAHHAAILCIGTELTTGQITNRNAAALSQWLTDLGVAVQIHETVPDDRPLILEALARCESRARLLFITGGLGPTTDDFTREVVAEWARSPLEFDEPSLAYIEARLAKIGISTVSSQRQQCYYPRGARILHNSEGTAHGFALEKDATRAWILPGPPREIAAVWQGNRIGEEIRASLPGTRPRRLFAWQCLGRGEADLGEITERALAGSGLATGYRFHRPYVEIKVWCDEDAEALARATPYLAKLEAEIAPWIAAKGEGDLGADCLALLARFAKTEIWDGATGGMLGRRIGDLLWAEASLSSGTATPPADAPKAPPTSAVEVITDWSIDGDPLARVKSALAREGAEPLRLAVAGFTVAGEWAIGLRAPGIVRQELLALPYRAAPPKSPRDLATERNRAFITELALKTWKEWLTAAAQPRH